MLWAAPLLFVLTIPAAAILGLDPFHPQDLAYLYGMALLGTWTALIPSKALETRRLRPGTRRLIGLGTGLLVGGLGIALASSVRLDGLGTPQLVDLRAFSKSPGGCAGFFPAYFGLLYAITGGWSSLAARDRKARFRILPILWTGLLAAAIYPLLWPYERPDGIAIAALIATGVQLVSPWNRAAALYARYVRASRPIRIT
jgi:hypothetical protein